MNEFDHLVALDSQNLGVEYSRYSDDITFSGPSRQVLLEIEKISASRLRDLSFPRLEFNPRKRVLVSSGSHRTVTGLTLATQGFVSIGRVRRRGIRAALHHLRQGKLSKDEILALRGEIAFAQGVEADFAVQLARTYGELVWKLVRGEI